MNTKSAVKSSMVATVYRARTTTLRNYSRVVDYSEEIKLFRDWYTVTKVRHDNQDPCTAILPAPYSALCARIFPSLAGQSRPWLARLNSIFPNFGFTGGRLLANSFFRRTVEEFDGLGDRPNALLTLYFVSALRCIALRYTVYRPFRSVK